MAYPGDDAANRWPAYSLASLYENGVITSHVRFDQFALLTSPLGYRLCHGLLVRFIRQRWPILSSLGSESESC